MYYSENDLSKIVVNICFKIHSMYGPGLFESVYEEIFCYELAKAGIPFTRQEPVPLIHEEILMNIGFRADVIVDEKVILEFKSVETLERLHYKQVQTYLKLTHCKLGLLINFNVNLIKDGIHRIVNGL